MGGLRALVLAAATGAAGRAHAVYVKPTMGGAVQYVAAEDIEVPTSAFPGATAAATNADWTSGKQPENLQYWPQASFSTHNRVMLPCYKTYVLEDTAAGWAGKCKALRENKMISTAETCKEFCRLEPRCAVWQFVNQTSPGQCWVGYGTHCSQEWGRQDGIVVEAGQRLQHGDVKVLAYLQGVKIQNLFNLPLATIDPTQGQKACKEWCYSDIACQYWQYHPQKGGCYVEARLFSTSEGQDQTKVVAYPLSLDSGAEANAQWQIGEYIAHYCPPEVQSPVTPVPSLPTPFVPYPSAAPQGGFPWAWIFAVIAVLLLCAGGGWYVYQQQQKQKKPQQQQQRGRGDSRTSGQRSARTGSDASSMGERQQQFDNFDGSGYRSNDEGGPLIPDGGAREAPTGQYLFDQQQGGSSGGDVSRGGQQQPQYSGRQDQSSAPYSGQGAYGQAGAGGGYGGQGGSSSSPYAAGRGGGQGGQPPGGGGGGGGGGGYGQGGQPPAGGGYGQGQGGSTMIPPPTQLVDFGQNPGRMAPTQLFQGGGQGGMAPTQLLNQGMPYSSATPGYPGRPGQRPQGMY